MFSLLSKELTLCFLFSSTGLSYRCGGVLTDATGWLSFTVNNKLLPFNMICHWTIIAPSDKRIVLTILNTNPDENEPVWYCKWNAVVSVSYHINIHSMPQLTQPFQSIISQKRFKLFMPQARKKNVTRPGLEPKVSRLLCEHSNH